MIVQNELAEALRKSDEAMDMQERRETGESHIPQTTARHIWDQARAGAKKALAAHAAGPAQVLAVRAKPLVWEHDRGEWRDKGGYGFCIEHRPDGDEDRPYVAVWGEGDPESFATLAAAQSWCQEAIDAWVRGCAVVDPRAIDPSESAAKRAIEARNEYLREHPGDAVPAMLAAIRAASMVDADVVQDDLPLTTGEQDTGVPARLGEAIAALELLRANATLTSRSHGMLMGAITHLRAQAVDSTQARREETKLVDALRTAVLSLAHASLNNAAYADAYRKVSDVLAAHNASLAAGWAELPQMTDEEHAEIVEKYGETAAAREAWPAMTLRQVRDQIHAFATARERTSDPKAYYVEMNTLVMDDWWKTLDTYMAEFARHAQLLSTAAANAARWEWGVEHAAWIRHEHCAYVAIPVARDANLSCKAFRTDAVDVAMAKGDAR